MTADLDDLYMEGLDQFAEENWFEAVRIFQQVTAD